MTASTTPMLFVSGDRSAAQFLEQVFRNQGYALNIAPTWSLAQQEIRRVRPAVILLDRQLIAREAVDPRQIHPAVPTIVLQPFDQSCGPDDCVSDLDAGFDLVFCSPRYRELIAHIRAILRRQHMESAPQSLLLVNGIAMDIARHEVMVAGRLVELTPKEYQILRQFLQEPGVVLTRQILLDRVWGENYALEEHALDVHIHSLRQKIEPDPSTPVHVITIRGLGYKLQAS